MKRWYAFARRTAELFLKFWCGMTYVGRENVPGQGGLLVVSNHISFLDPPMVACALEREIYFLGRKTLFKKNGFGWLISSLNSIPIDQERPDMNGLRNIIKLLRAGNAVLLFPEGARSPHGGLQEAANGVGLVAAKAAVTILPVRLFGSFEALPMGGKKLARHPLRVVIGKPFVPPYEELANKGKEGYAELSKLIMAEIAKIS